MPRNPLVPRLPIASVLRSAGTSFWMLTIEQVNMPAMPIEKAMRAT